jgi:hypothetical protein
MTLKEIYEMAKQDMRFGEPLIQLPEDSVMVDDRGRVFVTLDRVIKCIEGQIVQGRDLQNVATE